MHALNFTMRRFWGATQHATMLLVATNSANFLAFLANLVMARQLGPYEFGPLAVMLSLYLIVQPAAESIEMATTQRASLLNPRRDRPTIRQLTLHVVRMAALIGGAAAFAVVPASLLGAESVHVPPIGLGLLGLSIPVLMTVAASNGVLVGLNRFRLYGFAIIARDAGRLVFGVTAIQLGFGAEGAMAGILVALLLELGISLAGSLANGRAERPHPSPRLDVATIFKAAAAVLPGIAIISLLMNFPIVLVSLFFGPEATGHYGLAASLGKAVFFLPGAFSVVMLPRLVHGHSRGDGMVRDLRTAQCATLIVAGGAAAVISLLAEPIIFGGFGATFLPAAHLVPLCALAAALYALARLWLAFFLATGDKSFASVLGTLGLAQFLAIWVWHPGLEQVLVVLAIGAGALLVAAELRLLVRRRAPLSAP